MLNKFVSAIKSYSFKNSGAFKYCFSIHLSGSSKAQKKLHMDLENLAANDQFGAIPQRVKDSYKSFSE